jgi:hypothetical protein
MLSPYTKWACAVAAGVIGSYVSPTAPGLLLLIVAAFLGAISLPRHFWN